ncbi:hypothetical protein F5883DRAFT_656082 [Diaporthe sp. PMI_573]|nr:hypothetical protein F5883DRAFT_656082 [Diaporthaceae sp. PMI_573]
MTRTVDKVVFEVRLVDAFAAVAITTEDEVANTLLVPYAYKKTADFGAQRDAQGRVHISPKARPLHVYSTYNKIGEHQPLIDIELSRAFDVTWKAMETLVDKNKARSIGISTFSSPKLLRLLKTARIKPTVHQIECYPHWPQKRLVQLCQAGGIHVTAFRPLGCPPIPSIGRTTGPGPQPRGRNEARKARARVHDAFRLVKSFSDGQHIGLRPRFRTLNKSEYQDLLDRIKAEAELDGNIWKGFRFDYSPAEKRFTVHMVTDLHETFGSLLSTEIYVRV